VGPATLPGLGDVARNSITACGALILGGNVKILRWWAGSAAVVATTLVAACGSGSSGTTSSASSSPLASGSATASTAASVGPPPATLRLVKQVNSAAANASSVHITATLAQAGNNASLNFSLTRSNEAYGQISYRNRPVTVLTTRGHTYLKLTAAALKAMSLPSSVCVLMCNKYLKMTAGQSSSFLSGLGWADLVGSTSSLPRLHYVRTLTVNGLPAWEMSVTGGGTIDVAAQGTPFPLRLVKGADQVDFTEWNSVTIPPPPPAKQVVNLSQLQHL
jgi:hypothetical protein